MSLVMRKPTFCICENKDADQPRGNREADQRLCFRHIDSTIPLLSISEISKPLAIFCSRTAWFVSDLVGNTEDRFSHNEAHILDSSLITVCPCQQFVLEYCTGFKDSSKRLEKPWIEPMTTVYKASSFTTTPRWLL